MIRTNANPIGHRFARVAQPKRVAILGAGLLITSVLLGCVDENHRAGGIRRIDSAGVQIVANLLLSTSRPHRWTLVEDLEIGVDFGDDQLEFGQIADIAVVGGTNILVLDRTNATVRVFDHSGKPIRQIGRLGRGPGEFYPGGLDQIVAVDDTSFIVPDISNHRVSHFSLSGRLLSSFRLGVQGTTSSDWASAGDGVLRFRVLDGTWSGIVSMNLKGQIIDTLLVFKAITDPLVPGLPQKNRLLSSLPVWSTTWNGGFVHGVTTRYELSIHDSNGRLTRKIIVDQPQQTITALERSEFESALRDLFASPCCGPELTALSTAEVDIAMQMIEVPVALPFFARIETGPDRTLWVQRVPELSSLNPLNLNVKSATSWGGYVWDVLGVDGVLQGSITFRRDFILKTVHEREVYGVVTAVGRADRVVRYLVGG